MIKAVIFDMDGVIVDNKAAHFEAFKVFCGRHGFDCPEDKLLPLFGKGNEDIIPAMVSAVLIEKEGLEELSDEKETIYRELYEKSIVPAPHLKEFLNDIRSHGIRTAVGSSGPEANVDFVLEKCGITELFDAIANGDMVEHAKPDPEVFLLAAQLLDVEPADCMVIEDSFAGIKAAKSAGMKVVAIATTYKAEELAEKKPDMLIKGFGELDHEKIMQL